MNDKLILEFQQLGCKSRKYAPACLQVYLDLCEVKRYWDVEYFFSDILDTLYIKAKQTKSKPESIFIPIFSSDPLSFQRMQSFLTLATENTKSVNLAIVSADSTMVYYEIEEGLGKTQVSDERTLAQEKREKLDGMLKKNKKLLEQSALFGLPITLPKKEETTGTSLS